jgi:hypothetical protein
MPRYSDFCQQLNLKFHDLRKTFDSMLAQSEAYPLLLHKDFWSIHRQHLQTKLTQMLILSSINPLIIYQWSNGCEDGVYNLLKAFSPLLSMPNGRLVHQLLPISVANYFEKSVLRKAWVV